MLDSLWGRFLLYQAPIYTVNSLSLPREKKERKYHLGKCKGGRFCCRRKSYW